MKINLRNSAAIALLLVVDPIKAIKLDKIDLFKDFPSLGQMSLDETTENADGGACL